MVKGSSCGFGFVVKATELRDMVKKSEYGFFCESLVGTTAEKTNPLL